LRGLLSVFLIVLVTGCGWHLRGSLKMPAEVQVIAIDPEQPYEPFQKSLRTMLKSSGVQVVPLADKSAAVFHLIESSFKTQDLTIDAQGAVSEQLVILTVVFSMDDAMGKTIMPQQTVRIEHKITHDENQLLRQEAEERTLRRTLQEDAITQIMHRMIIQVKAKAP
jgi:LPS-assembly lipoprotein